MAKKQKEQSIRNEFLGLVMVLIGTFILGIIGVKILDRLAEKNNKICEAIGKVWLYGIPSEQDPNPRRGCFTYEEIFTSE